MVGRYIRAFGVWEPFQTQLTLDALRPGDLCLDIGAHHGYYSLLMSRTVGFRGHVYSFEPSRTASKVFRRHIEANGLGNVTLYQFALGDSESDSLFQEGCSKNTGNSHVIPDSETALVNSFYEVKKRRLDQFNEIDFCRVRLLKIDVEGFENEVLAGAAECLSKLQTGALIFLEVMHPAGKVLVELIPSVSELLGKLDVKLIPTDYSTSIFFEDSLNLVTIDPFNTRLFGGETIDLMLTVK